MVETQAENMMHKSKLMMQPDVICDGLKKREEFAVSLRRQKKKEIIRAKRQKLVSKMKQPLFSNPIADNSKVIGEPATL